MRWFNVNYFDTMDAIKSALLLNVLIPVKRLSYPRRLGRLPAVADAILADLSRESKPH